MGLPLKMSSQDPDYVRQLKSIFKAIRVHYHSTQRGENTRNFCTHLSVEKL